MLFFDDIPEKLLAPGISGHYAHGDKTTVGLVRLQAGATLAMHQHPHEQVTYMLKGELQLQVAEEQILLQAGALQIIRSGVPHGALALTDCLLLDFFSPVRQDYQSPA